MYCSYGQCFHAHTDTDSTELNTSASELEHFEMNTNDAYATNAAEIATTENIAYMTAALVA